MATKKSGLGKGLDILLSSALLTDTSAKTESIHYLDLDNIVPSQYQPRQEFDQEALSTLADSIRVQGVVQPIIVRGLSGGQYELIAGERRWRASALAGLTQIPAIIRELSDEATLAVALVENIQRENLNPLEEAIAMQRLINEFAMTHQEIARVVGKSRASVTNLLRLLTLDSDIKRMLQNGDIEMGHARALLPLAVEQQRQAAHLIVAKSLSVRETEQLVRDLQTPAIEKSKPITPRIDPDIRDLQNKLTDTLCAKVEIQHKHDGKGKLVIQYNSVDELEGILAHIK